ncbi:MAG: hypothetical protein SEPTF4163_001643 [Sporothrix epigloea]
MGKRKETADENLARMVTHHRAGSLAAVAMHQKRKREHDDDELVQFRIQMAKRQAFGGEALSAASATSAAAVA